MQRLFNLIDGTITGFGEVLAKDVRMVAFDDEDESAVPRLEILRAARRQTADGGSPFQESFDSLETAALKLQEVYGRTVEKATEAVAALDPEFYLDNEQPEDEEGAAIPTKKPATRKARTKA